MSDHDKNEMHDDDLLDEMGYEQADMDLSGGTVSKVSLTFIVFIIASLGVSWLYWTAADRVGFFKSPENQRNVERRELPPEVPILQSNITAHEDMVSLRKVEEAKLNAVGWNEDSDTAKIPVENAIEILAARGLPTRANPGMPDDYEHVVREPKWENGPVYMGVDGEDHVEDGHSEEDEHHGDEDEH